MSLPDSKQDRPYTAAEQIRYWLGEERRRLIVAVSGLTEEEPREPLEAGGWSVHGILAHRLFWEGREVEALGQYLLGKRVELLDFPLKRVNGTNAAAVETLRDHPPARLLRELSATRALLLVLVAKLPDSDFDDEDNEARLLLGVMLEHDREHSRQIQRWRELRTAKKSGAPPTPAPPPAPGE